MIKIILNKQINYQLVIIFKQMQYKDKDKEHKILQMYNNNNNKK